MKIKTEKEYSKIHSHDLTLKSISWPKDSENNLTIQCEDIHNKFVEFYFEWVANLKIDLSLGEDAQTMTWSIEAEINITTAQVFLIQTISFFGAISTPYDYEPDNI